MLTEQERRAWEAVKRQGRAGAADVATEMGEDEPQVRTTLEALWRRRLLMRTEEQYEAPGEEHG
jgi:predicted ArsR family transcriptional regulator